MDDDLVAGMLTAILMFVRDAFPQGNEELKEFDLGGRHVAVERGKDAYVAAIFPRELPPDVSRSIKELVDDLAERYGTALVHWFSVDDLPGLSGMLERFAERGRYRRGDWIKLARTQRHPGRGTVGVPSVMESRVRGFPPGSPSPDNTLPGPSVPGR